MSNGDEKYERAFKLFAQVMKLILDDKRSLERLCTALQRIVFEESGWPKFKNWPVICSVGKVDPEMMMVLATVDLGKDDDIIKQIISAFPDCFCVEQKSGPVPWAAFIQKAEDMSRRESGFAVISPFYSDTVEFFNIPTQGFVFGDEYVEEFNLPSLPEDFPRVGINGEKMPEEWGLKTVLSWRGKEFVVVEIDIEEIRIAPVECFDLGLPDKAHIVDCDADPSVPSGWNVEEHKKGGQVKLERRADDLYVNGRRVELYIHKSQVNGKRIEGYSLRYVLMNDDPGDVLNANILDYLLKNPTLIPDSWKRDDKGNVRFIYFWGTVYYRAYRNFYIRYLRSDGSRWVSKWRCADKDWSSRSPAARLQPES